MLKCFSFWGTPQTLYRGCFVPGPHWGTHPLLSTPSSHTSTAVIQKWVSELEHTAYVWGYTKSRPQDRTTAQTRRPHFVWSCVGSPKPDHNFQNRFSVLEAVKTGFPVLVRFWHFFLYKGVITHYNAVIGIENASIRLHRPIMIIKHSHYEWWL